MPHAGLLLIRSIEKTIVGLAHSLGRHVRVDHDDFDHANMPEHKRKDIKDALIQLARNSLKHGIEDPAERESAGKSPEANIRISSTREGDAFTLIYRDDGRGLDAEKIKARALETGPWTEAEIQGWGKKELVRAVLTSGFSTQEEADHHAGRGQGMPIIAAAGELEIDFEPGEFCEFRLRMKAENVQGT